MERVTIRRANRPELVERPHFETLPLETVFRLRVFPEANEILALLRRPIRRARIIRIAPIERLPESVIFPDVRDSANLIIRVGVGKPLHSRADSHLARMVRMEVRRHDVIDRLELGKQPRNIPRDPFSRSLRVVRSRRRAVLSIIRDIPVPRVDERRRSVRVDIKRAFADAGVDEVKIEIPFLPADVRLSDLGVVRDALRPRRAPISRRANRRRAH